MSDRATDSRACAGVREGEVMSESKITLLVELRPFMVPNFAVEARSRDGNNPASHPLNELDADTLDRLCSEFRRAVFEKAGKQDPR